MKIDNKNILLCVTGGIAVYKAVALVSKLSQAGANVKVVMTDSAKEFVQPLSFQVMSRNDVYFDTFDEKDSRVIAHIDLADWADLVVVAPATANVIGKLAHGIADNMVTTILLATQADVWIAPAMNVHMYAHPAVMRNIEQLHMDGYQFIEPSEGFLACGYVGKGRLEEPEKITELITEYFNEVSYQPLRGKKVVITAGPTRERIDPVRYVSNFSSGKMGYAMAEAAQQLGAHTVLISGPVELSVPSGVHVINVESAAEMFDAVISQYDDASIVVKSAAVADYRPKNIHDQKMKKKDGDDVLELERTTDILKTLGKRKENQLLIGFAAETTDAIAYGQKKLESKNLDYIIVNDVTDPGGGFGSETNVVTLLSREGETIPFSAMPKVQLAKRLFETILQHESSKLHDR
ncbi:bifunctional phosphopantothenoylcysteine decarboxylase/phosphopantothenate--cysteine ligase CoaBC [Sporosarcina sp. P21c]|uniref:bifunctional phosphopantothenoylcysteine decarboxylase/phosphopantothenate--cysteine ligase CoaBC n=1 Tax=unclassified Sporosarcina TaxID=2647733 RepID=UPI000C172B6C|nr:MULTISPECIES: bifunctional phosphopantothenoylcysteine decarboxylase/phosphopantothenate--cysteine ligase CoaBC [unclassified Sporosarcina]PIC68817.1 bifunctional phosphopantothenoylcysteine decarboxylase/phosphopantothenate--cysteine ligase CoaBC [Sporosarcina sp. P16a]PIC90065.1 bifunctional phosphopantothenoylcysteine decarboxylase/phosphopantothenate--cysteine ligase CoaBC [Sporosarcina sp. P21c]PIC92142.1 bifunctional phosphopantothenoylcysteine decarboxylase/phosphopantothenate--cystein